MRAASVAAKSFAAVALLFTLVEPAEACECGSPGPCQALSLADVVFTGVVTDISPVLTPDGNGPVSLRVILKSISIPR